MNSDCIVIMGSNMAENHPVGFQWVMEARERGARIFHVDPRFTRTSAMATDWIRIRAGSDIAFLGGVVNYILEHDRYFEEYVKHYTNAPVIIGEEFQDTEDLDGLFSGWDPEKGEYDVQSWQYAGMEVHGAAGQREKGFQPTKGEGSGDGRAAGSWRCAGTRRSRARPTSRPSTTSFRATCRCPTPSRTATSRATWRRTRRPPASGATSSRTG